MRPAAPVPHVCRPVRARTRPGRWLERLLAPVLHVAWITAVLGAWASSRLLMPSTPRGYPYPALGDPIDNGVGDLDFMKNLATAIDTDVTSATTTTTNRLLKSLADQAVAIWELEAKVLAQDNGLLDWHGDPFVPYVNRIASRTLDGSGFPILGVYRDVDRDQGFIQLGDVSPLADWKGNILGTASPIITGLGMALSPDKKWLVTANGTTMRSYAVSADGSQVDPTTVGDVQTDTAAALPANVTSGPSTIMFSPDGKAVIVGLQTTPFVVAYPFNTVTGKFSAKYANPAVLPASTVTTVAVTPNSKFVGLANSETAAPFFTVYAIDTVGSTWGAKSAAPAAPPASGTGGGLAFTDAGDGLFVAGTTYLYEYAFNQTTGVIGARVDAPSVPGSGAPLGWLFQKGGKVILPWTTTPFIHGWNFAAGAWSAKWANPAQLPATLLGAGAIADDAGSVFFNSGVDATSGVQCGGWLLNPTSFGARVIPSFRPSTNPSNVIPFPIENRADFLGYVSTTQLHVFGDKAGTLLLSGQATTTTKVLAANVQTVYLLDDFVGGAGVTRQYDVSLDGGATWTNNVATGVQVVLAVPGNQLKIRLTVTRPGTGVAGTIHWFACWAV